MGTESSAWLPVSGEMRLAPGGSLGAPGDARQVFSGPLSQQLFCYPQPHACQRVGLSWGLEEEGTSRTGPHKVAPGSLAALPPNASFSPPSRASTAAPRKSLSPNTPSLLRASSCRDKGLGDEGGHSGPEGGDLWEVWRRICDRFCGPHPPSKGSQKGSPLMAPTRAGVWRGGVPLAIRNLTSHVASALGVCVCE